MGIEKRFWAFCCVSDVKISNLEVVPFSFKSICIYANISVPVNIGNSRIWRLGGYIAQCEGCTFGKSKVSSRIIQILI